MENLGFNLFDAVVVGLILLLSIKGIISGFTKELFSSLGLIGGLFVASLYKNEVAQYLKDNFLHDISAPLLNLISFLSIFILIFIAFKLIYKLISMIFSDDYISATSRFAGMLIKMITLFFILAIITFGLSSNPNVFDKLKNYTEGSRLFPLLKNTGKFILNPNSDLNIPNSNSTDKNTSINTINKEINNTDTNTSKQINDLDDNKSVEDNNKTENNSTLEK